MLRTGLFMYDVLAGSARIHPLRSVSNQEVKSTIPWLRLDHITKVLSYWDMQTDDLTLVRRIAESALTLGGNVIEHGKVTSLRPTQSGW